MITQTKAVKYVDLLVKKMKKEREIVDNPYTPPVLMATKDAEIAEKRDEIKAAQEVYAQSLNPKREIYISVVGKLKDELRVLISENEVVKDANKQTAEEARAEYEATITPLREELVGIEEQIKTFLDTVSTEK